ncbi:unnamed protein product [Sphenostylis stenocarpa]|uniref:Uncharacterized protein n=1 Tax=Sphenostylis stenocarpa TaxID=92480 RepID=A0AA86SP33_9FABA|nr:unnamed protein product [Sphenostylis stenocarpa]
MASMNAGMSTWGGGNGTVPVPKPNIGIFCPEFSTTSGIAFASIVPTDLNVDGSYIPRMDGMGIGGPILAETENPTWAYMLSEFRAPKT